MRDDLPTGTVTFLFTDVEGSTKLLHELGAEGYAAALAEHRRVIREACTTEGGVEVDTQGDAFFVAFLTAPRALTAASAFTETLGSGPIQVRVGLHTGTAFLAEEGYVGDDIHLGARIAASAHGGQVILSSATAELVDSSLTDLGEHRLKDIEEAVAIFQLGDASFPPLKTISNTNLPRPASSVVGRERELAEVLVRVEQGARLVTVTGPGGSGKTRLSIEAATLLVPEYKAGVFWVGLASLRDPALVKETIALTLGAKDGLADHVGEREMLVLLDNLEQVIEAAPELSALLQRCPNLTLLVTSRELLRVRGEVEYSVPPLAESEAVALFCARAQVDESIEVAELCTRLDSLPLAVELAAARAKALSPAQILERLSQRLDLLKGGRDAEPRQQTLRATIEWSYDLLSDEERELLRRLSVFGGSCTFASADAICDADLDTLQSLVEKSLLRFSNERYWMLETIREYAAEQLQESGEAEELRRRHSEHFLALAEDASPELASHQKQWLDRLEAEHDNLRGALDEFETAGETQPALRLAGALGWFWYLRGHVAEAAHRLESALSADERPTAARAKALTQAAGVAEEQGDLARAGLLAEEALTLYRELGDAWGVAYSIHLLGGVAMESDWGAARQRFEESLSAFRELGDEHFVGIATDLLALAYYKLGDPTRALALCEENLRRARATGNARLEAKALGATGFYIVDEGRVDEALPVVIESTRIFRDLDSDYDEVALNLSSFARAAAMTGSPKTAMQLLAAVSALMEEIGAVHPVYMTDLNEATQTLIRTRIDEATCAVAWEEGLTLSVDDAVALA